MKARWLLAGLACVAAFVALPAQAGRSCEAQPPTAFNVQRAMTLAQRTARRLDASGAQVVVLARVGQDLSRYGQHYSHLGFAYRDGDRWRVVHKLNQCGSDRGVLYRQGLGEFFLDDLFRYEAGVMPLSPEAQAALLPVLASNDLVRRLDTPAYSMVAYPWAQTYQQSNQWAIETLASAEDAAADDRAHAQAWLRLHGYVPATLHLSAFERLGARLTSANVAFDDHPTDQRFEGRIDTVTADSVFAWLTASGFGGALLVIR